jgi:NADH pyrophosphatase NudC (nudix superfamily)
MAMSGKDEIDKSGSRVIRSALEYRYCPICGSETEKVEYKIKPNKTNQKRVCPEHGTLIHKKS